MIKEMIYIKWVDSYGCTSLWEDVGDLDLLPAYCETSGFLIEETIDSLIIANSINIERGREQVVGVMTVPKSSIIDRKKIK